MGPALLPHQGRGSQSEAATIFQAARYLLPVLAAVERRNANVTFPAGMEPSSGRESSDMDEARKGERAGASESIEAQSNVRPQCVSTL
jgi:hypothetical protein